MLPRVGFQQTDKARWPAAKNGRGFGELLDAFPDFVFMGGVDGHIDCVKSRWDTMGKVHCVTVVCERSSVVGESSRSDLPSLNAGLRRDPRRDSNTPGSGASDHSVPGSYDLLNFSALARCPRPLLTKSISRLTESHECEHVPADAVDGAGQRGHGMAIHFAVPAYLAETAALSAFA
jgi:hypothetical protein